LDCKLLKPKTSVCRTNFSALLTAFRTLLSVSIATLLRSDSRTELWRV